MTKNANLDPSHLHLEPADRPSPTANAAVLQAALDILPDAGLDAVVTTGFMSSYWLGSIAWDALTGKAVPEE
ncbi:hypothetical protein LJ751_13950 [Arthrobacter sp. zg-Y809]|uniref:Uncharacterized protein n=1 Tax=Arthrobacter gengyunqii TaxID=2886940 RepID=A0A9X1M2Z5_9MICC|nr:hypothetical protein [Arthrobacter gengyunqii]